MSSKHYNKIINAMTLKLKQNKLSVMQVSIKNQGKKLNFMK